jgi:formylmethanofuran dehydrogenase subunit B
VDLRGGHHPLAGEAKRPRQPGAVLADPLQIVADRRAEVQAGVRSDADATGPRRDTVRDGRIVEAARACPAGREWFGDGAVPSAVLRDGRPAALEEALAEAAGILARAAGRLLVHLAPDLTCEAQRAALALADRLRAAVDTSTSGPAAAGLLAAQRRGRAAATLGEIRNRADVLLFWAVDPAPKYPRYLARYALDPIGTHVPRGRAGRATISVSVGADRGPAGTDLALALEPAEEVAALSVMRATVLGNPLGELPPRLAEAAGLATRLTQARYAVLVHDAEPGSEPGRDPLRAEGLIALAQALNGPTRAALSSLRAGGNRSGAEAVLTWQTGYPLAVDFARGHPRYAPHDGAGARLARGDADAVLVVGDAARLREELARVGAVEVFGEEAAKPEPKPAPQTPPAKPQQPALQLKRP